MIETIKRLLKRIARDNSYSHIKASCNKLVYYGHTFKCPLCSSNVRKFLPYGRTDAVLRRMQVVGAGLRANALCPVCGSSDRLRLLYLFLRQKTDLFSRTTKLLHFAPEPALEPILRSQANIEYITTDLFMDNVTVRADITNMPFPGESFDAVICSHVLEYVPDDRKALCELLRILKPGGWAIVQEQIAHALETTYEDPAAKTPSQRLLAYGEEGHYRLYGMDYKWRLERAGFVVSTFDWTTEPEGFGLPANMFGLLEKEIVYVASKPAQESDGNTHFVMKPGTSP